MSVHIGLARAFDDRGFILKASVASSALEALASELALPIDKIAAYWEAFDIGKLDKIPLEDRREIGVEHLEKFEQYVRYEVTKPSTKSANAGLGKKRKLLGSASKSDGASPSASNVSMRMSLGGVTPKKMSREWDKTLDDLTPGESEYKKKAATPGSATGVGENANATLHGHLSATANGENSSGCDVRVSTWNTDKFRYMRDRISDRVTMIDARILDAQERFEFVGDDAEEGDGGAGAVGAATRISRVDTKTGDEDATCVGRIVCAHKVEEGKLTDKTVSLEGSTEGSFGARVRLELRDLDSYSLFPGQVVKVTGRNPAGHCLVVKSISSASSKPMKKSAPTASVFAMPTSVVVASGPFSCTNDLKYEPLNDLLDFVAAENPDALILCGPLVDVENAFVKTGSCGDMDFDDIARNVTLTIERKLGFNDRDSKLKTKVIYVPSVRDAMLDSVFPQPAPVKLAKNTLFESSTRAFVAPNPGTFEINGVVFSVVTHDILKHLSAQEISKGGVAIDRLSRLATHVISQAYAYPLYPADPSACLDAAHAGAAAFDVTPDVLILPSDLKTFAEVLEVSDVGKVVCVNPGRLARGDAGGTLAKLVVHAAPTPSEVAADDEDVVHGVAARARVDVLKIK